MVKQDHLQLMKNERFWQHPKLRIFFVLTKLLSVETTLNASFRYP